MGSAHAVARSRRLRLALVTLLVAGLGMLPGAHPGADAAPDGTLPVLQTRWPFKHQVFAAAGAVRFEGTVSDDLAVGTMELSVRSLTSGQWVDAAGRMVEGAVTLKVPLTFSASSPRLAGWSYELTPPAPDLYEATLILRDRAGNTVRRGVPFEYRPGLQPSPSAFGTLLMSRSQWVDATRCTPTPGGLTLVQVAVALRNLGRHATHTIVSERPAETARTCDQGFQVNASWRDLARLRDEFGWSAAVHHKDDGTDGTPLGQMPPAEQADATCGDLQRISDRGFTDAWGLFAYNGANVDAAVQADVVSDCFAFGRRYGSGVNKRGDVKAPWWLSIASVDGGYCNDVTAACFDLARSADGTRYQMPDELAARLIGYRGTYGVVQFYRLVTGQNLSGTGARFDCTDPDPARHWTERTEVYCINDFRAAVRSIRTGVTMTSPAAVADAWGRSNPAG